MSTAHATPAEKLAEFVRRLEWDHIPVDVRDNAVLRVLDTIGLALASHDRSYRLSIRDSVIDQSMTGPSTVIGDSLRASPSLAALINGTAAHGLDYDDTHPTAVVHASVCLVPAALSVAEAQNNSGREIITALVAGYESMVRLGAAAPGQFHARGFHATAITGTLACALVAGRLIGLKHQQLVSALGIAGSLASGITEFLSDGSWVKRIHPGWAAHNGIMAAQMARHGVPGPKTILEGRFGLYRTHLGADSAFNVDQITTDLGIRWETPSIAFKPYPACHFVHAFIDCAGQLRLKFGLKPKDIVSIKCYTPEAIVPFVFEPVAQKQVPRTEYEAKFSVPYVVAAMLVNGNVEIETFDENRLSDPQVLALARRVTHEIDPHTTFPRYYPGRIQIVTSDGRQLEHDEPINRGTAENPLTAADIEQKFLSNIRYSPFADSGRELVALINNLPLLDDINQLTTRLQVSTCT